MFQKIWTVLRKWFGHTKYIKYWVLTGTFLVIMCFVDENNFFKRISNQREIQNLEDQIESCNKSIRENREKINELQTSNSNLEKFAREQHLMKRPNEDIFIIKEKD